MSVAVSASSSARRSPLGSRSRSGNDQAIVAQELQKLALYVDASPQSPKELDHEALDAVGADLHEGDVARLADLALSGELSRLADELACAPAGAGSDSGGSRAAAAVADAGACASPDGARRIAETPS